MFCGHVTRADGTHQDVHLFRASNVPIRRHTKIKGEANPYDPQWEPYFEARQGVRMGLTIYGANGNYCACGRRKTVSVRSAINASPT